MKAVFVLLDSLNRHFLSLYGSDEGVLTPNIDRLAKRSVVFENHWCGSAPCMPARRDILTGRLNFLERPWGGIEPFDHTLPTLLQEKNVYTHMETDHFHYSERGGENYWGDFTSWNLHRGTEHDTINWGPDKTGIPNPEPPNDYIGLFSPAYEKTRKAYGQDADSYSSARTLSTAAGWLDKHHDDDNFLLWIEAFDPHEPFDVPNEFLELYQYELDETAFWPDYITADNYTDTELERFRNHYKASVTMADKYVGKVLDTLDKYDMWEDTMVVLTTDHGYMLGEHGYMAKCYMSDYNEVFHIPLLIAAPDIKPDRCSALTQNIDLFPTLLEVFDVPIDRCKNPIHGKSLLPLLNGSKSKVRDEVLFGVFGKTVNIYDGEHVYMRAPKNRDSNMPLYIYGSMMTLLNAYIGHDTMSEEEIMSIDMGRFLNWTNYPVYKVPTNNCHWKNNALRFDHINNYIEDSLLFNLSVDYSQNYPIDNTTTEDEMIEKLKICMALHDSPKDQYERLGL